VGEVTDQVPTATTVTTPKTQLQPAFGPSMDSLCHPWFTTTNLSYRFPIFETSATALRGTTGFSMVPSYFSIRISVKISKGFLREFFGISMGFL
jgi:hypothetical protein